MTHLGRPFYGYLPCYPTVFHGGAACAAVQEGLLSAMVGGVPHNNGLRRGHRGGGRLGA